MRRRDFVRHGALWVAAGALGSRVARAALPRFDYFNRPDSSTLGPNWINMLPSTPQIISEAAYSGTDLGSNAARWGADSFPDNQYVQADFTLAVGKYAGPLVRAQGEYMGNPLSWYRVVVGGGNDTVYLSRKPDNSGDHDNEVSLTSWSFANSGAHRVRVEVMGQDPVVITVYIDGTPLSPSYSDSHAERLLSGSAGLIWIFGTSSGSKADNWEGGALTTAPKPIRRRMLSF